MYVNAGHSRERLGCHPKCVCVTQQQHGKMKKCVLHHGDQSKPFSIDTNVT